MKRAQFYSVTITHFAEYRVCIEATSREEAKSKAKNHFDYSYDGPVKEYEKITKVTCLGTAEKTKARKK